MLLVSLLSIIFRVAELAFAAIVAGLTGVYLHAVRGSSSSTWDQGRFIYAEVVAGLSIVFALLWLLPFAGSFVHWPADLVLSAAWFVAFGLLVRWLHGSCGGVFDWSGIAVTGANRCPQWKADLAFAFLSAVCWLASALLGLYWIHRHRTAAAAAAVPPAVSVRRRRWYRSRV